MGGADGAGDSADELKMALSKWKWLNQNKIKAKLTPINVKNICKS